MSWIDLCNRLTISSSVNFLNSKTLHLETIALVIDTKGFSVVEPIKIIDLVKQIIKFSGLEPYKDIDIKIVGARKGERLVEPLWLKEENPTPTKYKKLLKLKNIEYDSDRLKTLLEKLYPICFYTKGYEEDFRNKEKLLSILCEDCQSLKDFYQEIKTDGQKRTDIL